MHEIGSCLVAASRHVGRRGAYLSFLALLDWLIGYSLTASLPLGLTTAVLYRPMLAIAPLRVWACWWAGTGLLCAVAVVWHRVQSAAFGAATLVKLAWAACYVWGWGQHLPLYVRGWQTAAIFGAFGLITLLVSGWRENGR